MTILPLVLAAVASASPVQNGVCVSQAWLIVEKGERVERLRDGSTILKSGGYEYYIRVGPAPKSRSDYGVRYLERSAVYVATPHGTYSLTSNNPQAGWAREALRHLQTGEAGRAACRRAARR